MTFTIRSRWEFKAADCWVGIFWRVGNLYLLPSATPVRTLDIWICLVPMLPLHLTIARSKEPILG